MSDAVIRDNAAWAGARPVLSVLIPFLRDDPRDLLAALGQEAEAVGTAAEIILLDDGTGDASLTAGVAAAADALGLPARLMTLARNLGRSEGRNRLAAAARSDSLLFLDSDMRPDRPGFLAAWVAKARDHRPAVAFGGISLKQAPRDARFAVHRSMAARSDCVAHDKRMEQPEKYVFTSNLLVRRDVFEAEGFDAGFTGWGWEDVEWAMRVSRRFPITHIDNPATHMGLDTVQTLAAKYAQSAPNFARLARRHPDIVAAYPSYRLARLLGRVPGLGLASPWLRRLAEADGAPVAARAFSLRLYRTTLYAQALKGDAEA